MEGGQGMVAQFDLENHLRAPIEVKAAGKPEKEAVNSPEIGRERTGRKDWPMYNWPEGASALPRQ
jgi:hypothetical protein